MKKMLALFMSLITVFTVCFGSIGVVYADSIKCGENLYASYDSESSTLSISGTGTMYDYSLSSLPAWNGFGSEIKSVLIEATVESVGKYAFYSCNNLEKIVFYSDNCFVSDITLSIPKNDNLTIYAREGTSIYQKAQSNGYNVKNIFDIIFVDMYGNTLSINYYPEGTPKEDVIIPEITPKYTPYTLEGKHYVRTGVWDKTITDVTASRVYQESKNKTKTEMCSYAPTVITPSTCITKGTSMQVCTKCGYIDTSTEEELPLGEHDYEVTSTTDSTCTQLGQIKYTCKVCKAEKTVDIPAKGHNYENGSIENYNNSTHGISCVRNCGDVKVESCKFVTNVVKQATKLEEGKLEHTCYVCGYSYTEVIPKVDCDHSNVELRNATDPTCTQKGYSGDTYCTECGLIISGGEVISALGHNFPNNCEKCDRCGSSNPNYTVPTTETTTKTDSTTTTATTEATTTTTTSPATTTPTTTTVPVVEETTTTTTTQPVTSAQTNVVATTQIATTQQPTVATTVQPTTTQTATTKSTTVSKPKKTSIKKITKGKKQFKITWKKISGVSGYQIQYSTSSKFKKAKTVTVSGSKSTSKTIKKLTSKKKYYVRVRTYKKVKVNGKTKTYYSNWTTKSITVK